MYIFLLFKVHNLIFPYLLDTFPYFLQIHQITLTSIIVSSVERVLSWGPAINDINVKIGWTPYPSQVRISTSQNLNFYLVMSDQAQLWDTKNLGCHILNFAPIPCGPSAPTAPLKLMVREVVPISWNIIFY